MKNTTVFAILIILLSLLTACTQNEGYIGDLFGIWRLEEITNDTTIDRCDTIFMAFQATYSKYDESTIYLTITHYLPAFTPVLTTSCNATF